jgi:hypothetical protein
MLSVKENHARTVDHHKNRGNIESTYKPLPNTRMTVSLKYHLVDLDEE